MSTIRSARIAPACVAKFSLGLLAALAAPALAQEAGKAGDAVPLSKIVMFNSGVGYFERQGEVDGNAQVELKFRSDDINDLLKSLVLEDRGGGKISTVTYGSRDPITKTLQSFPIDLNNNPTLGEILNQVRGEKIEVVSADAPDGIQGTLLGIEKRQRPAKDDQVVEVEYLNLLTDEGLRSTSMDSIGRVKLLNAQLDQEFQQALALLATAHNSDKKSVTLDFLGEGKRPVRVGYIQQTPVWKTSYRLVLDDAGKPYLQGWAIVENTSDEDWNNVKLTLVSGRPISYRMDLYEPLYVERPLEQLELFSSLRPQTYGQDLAKSDIRFGKLQDRQARHGRAQAGGMGGSPDESAGRAMPEAAPAPPPADAAANEKLGISFFVPMGRGATPSAQGAEVGELFQYAIENPVTLARQKSAMLPIVNESVEGEKVSIYNPAVQAKHPLNGLRLVNSTDLHLMQGPITVFDGATYAGDAKIEDLAPGAERLVSYALDLKTEVSPEYKGRPEELVSVKLVKGTLEITRKYQRETEYTVKNSDSKARTVLVEKPREGNWKLTKPSEATETTRDRYRFAVNAEPGKPTKLAVVEEQIAQQSVAVSNLDDNFIGVLISQKAISPEVKTALQDVVKRKQALGQLAEKRGQLEQRIASISEEQTRIRQNMQQLDRNSELYRRYVQKFGEQETSVEALRAEIEKLVEKINELQKSLEDYLVNLTI